MNITQLKAMLASKRVRGQLINVWSNVFYHNFSVDHILNRKGEAVLAFRVRDDKLCITDKSGSDITKLFLELAKGF